ncbi:hypothetical protein [Rhodococcus opacus]|nr:hypothetical protein [Rhodococcus opacus]
MSDVVAEHWCEVVTKAALLGLIESDDSESLDLQDTNQEKNT